jgi:hypothetical protein
VLFLFSYSSCAIATFLPVSDFGLPPFLPQALAAFIFTSLSDNRIIGKSPRAAWLPAGAGHFQITEFLLFIGNIFGRLFGYWQRKRRGVNLAYDTTTEKNYH